MDFWSRLIGGSSSSRHNAPQTPQQRLARFKRTYDQIRLTYQKSPLLQAESPAAETIRSCFQRLTTIIQDESRAPAPHLCLQFAASAQIYATVSRIGAVAQHEGIIRETVGLFQALIESEEEGFLENERFAHALMVFVERTAGSGNLYVGEDTEGEIIELLFGIAAKIRLQPEILQVWFRDRVQSNKRRHSLDAGGKEKNFVGLTSKEDFPLCYHLIDHVHHEGRIGDFARTGLLYIFESASKSEELEQWIVASDMPTLMATGLGALYSQLSRKLSIIHPEEDLPIILKLSDYQEMKAPAEAEGLYTEYLQGHLTTFLSHLTFWQDVLEHCRSIDVRQTLLDHLQVLFLQQLLYPSMLESSDIDGGSSVAVLTYLRQILDTLDHAELINLVLQYLLALPEPKRARSPTAIKRKSSLLLLTQPANEDDRMNPALFNLVDLLQSSVTSENPQTVIAALKLTTVILSKNHFYAIDTLLQTQTHPQTSSEAPQKRTHGALNAEVEAYMSLAESIGGPSGLDESYDAHLKDAMRLLESHSCSGKLLDLGVFTGSTATKPLPSPVGPGTIASHTIPRDDMFLGKLLTCLKGFWTNNVELNLAVTEVWVALFSCPFFGLEGWAAVEPRFYVFNSIDGDGAGDEQQPLKNARRRPSWTLEHEPAFMSVFRDLKAELDKLKSAIPDLDGLVAARKQVFRLHGDIEDAIRNPPPVKANNPKKNSQQGGGEISSSPGTNAPPSSLQQRLLDAVSPSPSRSQSRSRRADITSSPTSGGGGFLSQYAPGLQSSPQHHPTSTPSRSRPHETRMGRNSSDSGSGVPDTGLVAERQLLEDVMRAASESRMQQRLVFPIDTSAADSHGLGISGHEEGDRMANASSRDGDDGGNVNDEKKSASLGHILTNAVVLQEFVLEITAIMQVRASMLGEVAFV
ncbi:uncharacterized protein PV09_08929 [Verruconis gallopava]|uniref:Retinoic acid induced 16-like protein-domain-containing protein n=1 Tax=Verruconis gallopava TaxID=253628 RepID=A0A0D1ZZ86_9PEZI|nr:uncharacterized protein PV09_08929 [Verruconis gallopava]KIV99384.1 hypothetical protein PV09_08929 [Verruconis gallopava]